MPKLKYTCACCGHRTLSDSAGSYEICQLCGWEDDPIQLLDPWYQGGANRESLVEAQRTFASRRRDTPYELDPEWRMASERDHVRATTPAKLQELLPNSKWPWYYWKAAVMGHRDENDDEDAAARQELVALARDMLSGRVSYLEGAPRLCTLRARVGGVPDRDADFDAFTLISSETDHLPLQAQRGLWSAAAIERFGPELARTEEWASEFARAACKNIIARFAA